MDVTTALAKIGRGPAACEDLECDEAHQLLSSVLQGKATPLQLGALMVALRWKGCSSDEMTGFARALTAVTRRLALPNSPRKLAIIPSYSAHHRQVNLMPALALRLARAGVPVLVHGGLGDSTPAPSFAVFEALGFEAARSISEAQEALTMRKLALLPTQLLSPELDRLLALRTELGARNLGHQLARLLDPAPGHSLRLICSSDTGMLENLAQVLAATCSEAILMRATDGEPYANPERRPRISWFSGGEGRVLYEEDSFPASPQQTPTPADPVAVAAYIDDMLDGRKPTPVPLANQLAACFVASGYASDLDHAKAMVAVGYGRHS
ncbi:DNA-binding protein YbiB [Niveibacterium terrae]|uniref:DNA-binding protein YbiB n=1 Tax=Niveibacterium terrae TaxID=3373598 RepID=UPI003A917E63